MGQKNSRPSPAQPSSTVTSPGLAQQEREVFYQKTAKSEKKMIVYNWIPKNFTKTKASKKLCRLVKKRRYLIKSVTIDKDTLATRNSELIRTLPKMKCLKSINIDFWGNIELQPESFAFLARALRPLKNLKSCSIMNHDPDIVSIKGASQVIQSLSLLRNAKQTRFYFSDCINNNITEEVMKYLMYKLTKLRQAQEFSLNFSSCEALSKDNLKLLGRRMARFTHVSDLKMDFSYCPALGKDGIRDFVQKICLLKLTCLEMKFGGKKLVSDDELIFMSKEIAKLVNLTQLSLTLEGYESIKEQGLNFLVECINQLKKLNVLQLDLTGCKSIKDSELVTISENIAFFERLKHLKMYLFNTSISDIGMIKLAENFVRLHEVESLDLAFGGYEFLDNFGPPKLAQSLSGMKNLQVLKVELVKTKISDEGLEKFMKNISKLDRQLKLLHLKFCQSNELTGKGICALSDHIVKFVNLNNLELDFSHSSNITSDGVLTLTGNIWKLTKLQRVVLRFQSCMKLSKTAQEALKVFDFERAY